jgi:hypothetical protein
MGSGISEDGESKTKKAWVAVSRPPGSKPMVDIPSRIGGPWQSTETDELLPELVDGVRDLSKVMRGLVRLGVRMHKQNAELIRLGEWQVYLAEQARGDLASGSGSETEEEDEGSENDKRKGKGKDAEDKDKTLKDGGDLGSGVDDRMVS